MLMSITEISIKSQADLNLKNLLWEIYEQESFLDLLQLCRRANPPDWGESQDFSS